MKKRKLAALSVTASFILCSCTSTPSVTEITTDDSYIIAQTVPALPIPEITETAEPLTTTKTPVTTKKSETTTKPPVTTTAPEITSELETETTTEISETTEKATTTKAPETKPVTEATTTVVTTAATTPEPPPPTQPPATEPPATTPAPATIPADPSPATVLAPVADGVSAVSNALATIDYSHTSDGYVMAKYTGSVGKIKVMVINPNGVQQIYNLNTSGSYDAYPLTGGDGSYTINVLESVGVGYTIANTATFNVTLSSFLAPYIRPSQYVNYSYGDSAVSLASQLCAGATTSLEKLDRIYSWIVNNVSYDYDFASSNIAGGYAGDTYKVVNQRKGICLDYAATMAAMLRSQNIPAQVVSGDAAGSGFHAWVNVYLTESGTVYGGAIAINGNGWQRMDPTFAATSNSSASILSYIANDANYYTDFIY